MALDEALINIFHGTTLPQYLHQHQFEGQCSKFDNLFSVCCLTGVILTICSSLSLALE